MAGDESTMIPNVYTESKNDKSSIFTPNRYVYTQTTSL